MCSHCAVLQAATRLNRRSCASCMMRQLAEEYLPATARQMHSACTAADKLCNTQSIGHTTAQQACANSMHASWFQSQNFILKGTELADSSQSVIYYFLRLFLPQARLICRQGCQSFTNLSVFDVVIYLHSTFTADALTQMAPVAASPHPPLTVHTQHRPPANRDTLTA